MEENPWKPFADLNDDKFGVQRVSHEGETAEERIDEWEIWWQHWDDQKETHCVPPIDGKDTEENIAISGQDCHKSEGGQLNGGSVPWFKDQTEQSWL